MTKMLVIVGDLREKSALRLLQFCRQKSEAVSLYLAPYLIESCLRLDPFDTTKDLEFICKNIAIQISVNSLSSKDLEMKVNLLVALLSTRKSELFVLQVLEEQLINQHKKSTFSIEMVENIFKAYSQSNVKSANYGLLDVISADLLKIADSLDITKIRRVLLSMKQLKYSNAGLLNGLNRRLFSIIN